MHDLYDASLSASGLFMASAEAFSVTLTFIRALVTETLL